jgi:hypothetical protein
MADPRLLSVLIPYQVFPLKQPVKGLPNVAQTWCPVLKVAIIVGHASSKRFEAIVDSGSAVCLFHADIGKPLGLKLKDGERDSLGGVVGGSVGEVYYHQIKLNVMSDIIPITAGFSQQLSVAAILGRHGFFEHFTVTFDPCNNPPGLLVERVHRA